MGLKVRVNVMHMGKKSSFQVRNIWNKEDFDMCGLGKKNKFIAKIKHIKRCIRWSKQRIVRGYVPENLDARVITTAASSACLTCSNSFIKASGVA